MKTITLPDAKCQELFSVNFTDYENSELFENEFVIVCDLIAKYSDKKLYTCDIQSNTKFSIKLPKYNLPYIAAINACCDQQIPLVLITGAAGTGKTVAATSSIAHLWKKQPHTGLTIIKENILSTENSLGYLKGTLEEKTRPIFDYLKSVFEFIGASSKSKFTIDLNMDVELKTLGYVLGETFYNKYIIVDEAQNLTSQNVDLLVTRMGSKSKMVILGDNNQCYNRNNKKDTGISYLEKVMKGSKMFSHVTLTDASMRSPLVSEFLDRKEALIYREG